MQTVDLREFTVGSPRPTISVLLRRDIDSFVTEFRTANRLLHRAKKGELSPGTFGRYLCSIHYLLRHTPIHLSLAETRSRQLGHDELAAFFAHKRAEEDGHHRWAEADMSRFAERFNISIPTDPSPTMRALVDANTDTVMDDPFLYLAYILLTEYFVVRTGSEWIAALSENCGIPASMVTAVGNHAELDKDHVEEGCAEIDALVGPERVDSVRRALGGMIDRLRAFSEDLCDDVN